MNTLTFHRFSMAALSSACAAVLLAACGGGSTDSAVGSAGAAAASGSTSVMLAETTVSTSWTRCAVENAMCNFSGTKTVRYGLNGTWATRTVAGPVSCSNTVFGDPLPGANKVCDIQTTTTTPTTTTTTPTTTTSTTWKRCATEYGTCSFSGMLQVRYGLNDKWAYKTATGSIACNNNVFGDPYPGANKVCDVATPTTTTTTTPTTTTPTTTTPTTTTSSWKRCASEYGTCSFSGTLRVRYGLNDKWAYKTATGSIACNNSVFGDPYPGANKVCDVETPTTTTTTPTTTTPTTTTPTTPTTTTPTTPTTTTTSPYGQDASAYTLTFQDEFNGSFNTAVWNDKIWYETGNATKNYTVEDGKLKIWPQRDASGNFFNRTIDTDGKYYQTYGYFEIDAKLPTGMGTWPAFWLFNHIGSRRPEMDVMEAYAGGAAPWGFTDANGIPHPQAYAPTVWKGDYDGQLVGTRQYDTGMDLSAGFHKYAVKWEPNKQTYYFDGKEVLTLNTTFSDPMYLMLDLWFGSASGTPDYRTPQGKTNSFEINYIRAWRFK